MECKSGYGLNLDTEVKMLKVIERAKRRKNIDISSTYCGAHAVPKYVYICHAEHFMYYTPSHFSPC